MKYFVLFTISMLIFSSCEFFELSQEESFDIDPKTSRSEITFSAIQYHTSLIGSVNWTVSVCAKGGKLLKRSTGTWNNVTRQTIRREVVSLMDCDCAGAQRVIITLSWYNEEDRFCFEHCRVKFKE